MQISPLIAPQGDPEELTRVLDAADDASRVQAVTDLGSKELAALFEAAVHNAPLTLEHFVPASVPPLTEVIHEGKNGLAMFTRFQKRFCRAPEGAPELWGYNEQTMRAFTGPGYFVAYVPTEALALAGSVVIDYRRVPPSHPDAWPNILPNSARLSRFIYNGTVDVMRRVSAHVSIGRAMRGNSPMDAWFALVRRS